LLKKNGMSIEWPTRIPAARHAWLEALAIFDKLQQRDTSEVRARLSPGSVI
jgi:hypothetical protein